MFGQCVSQSGLRSLRDTRASCGLRAHSAALAFGHPGPHALARWAVFGSLTARCGNQRQASVAGPEGWVRKASRPPGVKPCGLRPVSWGHTPSARAKFVSDLKGAETCSLEDRGLQPTWQLRLQRPSSLRSGRSQQSPCCHESPLAGVPWCDSGIPLSGLASPPRSAGGGTTRQAKNLKRS